MSRTTGLLIPLHPLRALCRSLSMTSHNQESCFTSHGTADTRASSLHIHFPHPPLPVEVLLFSGSSPPLQEMVVVKQARSSQLTPLSRPWLCTAFGHKKWEKVRYRLLEKERCVESESGVIPGESGPGRADAQQRLELRARERYLLVLLTWDMDTDFNLVWGKFSFTCSQKHLKGHIYIRSRCG